MLCLIHLDIKEQTEVGVVRNNGACLAPKKKIKNGFWVHIFKHPHVLTQKKTAQAKKKKAENAKCNSSFVL